MEWYAKMQLRQKFSRCRCGGENPNTRKIEGTFSSFADVMVRAQILVSSFHEVVNVLSLA